MTAKLQITDHALVRWLERTGALDVEHLRALLADSLERSAAAAEQLGSARYLIVADGLAYVVRDDRLVTVLDDRGPYDHAHQLSARASRPTKR